MNTLQKIASQIQGRGEAMGWKINTKTADNLNMECWCGAYAALLAVGHEDTEHVGRVLAMVIAPRGYRETLQIVTQAKADEAAAATPAVQVARK